MVKFQALNLQLCRKINFTKSMFQLICSASKNTCFKQNFKEKSNNFETQYILYYSKSIALHFQLVQLVRLIDRWSVFYETRMNRLIGQELLSSAINKKGRETWKSQCGSTH